MEVIRIPPCCTAKVETLANSANPSQAGSGRKAGPAVRAPNPSQVRIAPRQRFAVDRGGGMQSSANATASSKSSFKVGEMAVHPAHGVGEVERLEERDFGGKVTACYVIKIRD